MNLLKLKLNFRKFSLLLCQAILIILMLSCNKKKLTEEETAVVNKFLVHEWYDLSFVEFSQETITNEARFSFKLENSKLKHIRNTFYSASFGDKKFHDEGDVNIYYDKEKESLILELLNKENKVIDEGQIKIPRDKIISSFNQQIKNREKITSVLNKRRYNELSEGEFDQRGIFESMISRMYQTSDFSMHYVYDRVTHLEGLGDFKPFKIEGFYSTAGNKGITWSLKEIFVDSIPKEIGFNDIKNSFDTEEVYELLNKLKGPLKYYDSNIADEQVFKSNNFIIDFDLNDDFEDEYGQKRDITIPVGDANYNFINDWYGKSDKVFGDIEVVKNKKGQFNVFININNSLETGGKNWLRLYVEQTNSGRIYFFNQNKYFALTVIEKPQLL